jgi:lipoate-protein ligase A
MLCISLKTHDPYFNLALEEVLLRNRKDEFFIIGINDPALIIGKHQVAHMEADTRFITENKIPIIRRISGGGTVFHDYGNLNFTFIRNSEAGRQVDFRRHTRPVIDFLVSQGVNATFEGRNDIRVEGLKISGNAEHIHRNRVLHHGTLLFSSSLDMLRNSIRSDKSCYASRAVSSNPSPVINLKDKLPEFSDINEFSQELMHFLSEFLPDFEIYDISREDTEEASALANAKYKTWEWNFAYGPEYIFNNTFQSGEILHSLNLTVIDGIVKQCVIGGGEEMIYLAQKLNGCRHMVSEFQNVLEKENIGISGEEIFNFF